MSSGTIQIPVLFDMSGDTIVFGEDTDGDFVSSHLDFVLDMTTEANGISLNASDISAAILVGDQDTGDNIFYSNGQTSVDELCNRIAKAITRGKLVHLPKTGNHSNSGIPMGGRSYLVDTNGINQENTNLDKYAIKYTTSIAPIGDEQMLGEAMARVASIHLVGSPLSAGIFQSATSVQTDLETASSQTFGSTAFYNALAVQLSKVLGGSKSSYPMNNGAYTSGSGTPVNNSTEYSLVSKYESPLEMIMYSSANYKIDSEAAFNGLEVNHHINNNQYRNIHSVVRGYNATSGVYEGSHTTTVDGVSIGGEWLQADCGVDVWVNRWEIAPTRDWAQTYNGENTDRYKTNQTKDIIIAYSLDGSTWSELYHHSSTDNTTEAVIFSGILPAKVKGRYFRWIVNTTNASTMAEIRGLNLFGQTDHHHTGAALAYGTTAPQQIGIVDFNNEDATLHANSTAVYITGHDGTGKALSTIGQAIGTEQYIQTTSDDLPAGARAMTFWYKMGAQDGFTLAADMLFRAKMATQGSANYGDFVSLFWYYGSLRLCAPGTIPILFIDGQRVNFEKGPKKNTDAISGGHSKSAWPDPWEDGNWHHVYVSWAQALDANHPDYKDMTNYTAVEIEWMGTHGGRFVPNCTCPVAIDDIRYFSAPLTSIQIYDYFIGNDGTQNGNGLPPPYIISHVKSSFDGATPTTDIINTYPTLTRTITSSSSRTRTAYDPLVGGGRGSITSTTNGPPAFYPWPYMNLSLGEGFETAEGKYHSTTGVYEGAETTDGYAGEWIQQDFGEVITGVYAVIVPNAHLGNRPGPANFRFVYSLDGTNWTTWSDHADVAVTEWVGSGRAVVYANAFTTARNPVEMRYVRYIVNKINVNNQSHTTADGMLHIFGYTAFDKAQALAAGSTVAMVPPLDASGTSVPALKSIFEQLMNIPGRSQIMETRDVDPTGEPTLVSAATSYIEGTNVSLLAGSNSGEANGTGSAAQFNFPSSGVYIGTDLYVCDRNNDRIVKITEAGVVTTHYDAGTIKPSSITTNGTDLYWMSHVGSLYKTKTDGTTTLIAGAGGDSQPNAPNGWAVDGNGTDVRFSSGTFDLGGRGITYLNNALYIADVANNKIRKVNLTNNDVSTFVTYAQNGSDGFLDPAYITTDGTDLYVSFENKGVIGKIDVANQTTTAVVGAYNTQGAGGHGNPTYGTPATDARPGYMTDMFYYDSNLYIVERYNDKILKYNPTTTTLSVLAGDGSQGDTNAALLSSNFKFTKGGIAISSAGIIALMNDGNHQIRKISGGTAPVAAVYTTVQGTNKAGGFPFIPGDKLVMYLRPKIVFAAQTFAEQHTTLLGFANKITPIIPVYNISNDGNGEPATSVFTGQSYSHSSSLDTNKTFENACHELQIFKNAGDNWWVTRSNTYIMYNQANRGEHEGTGITTNIGPNNDSLSAEWGEINMGVDAYATKLELHGTGNAHQGAREFKLFGKTVSQAYDLASGSSTLTGQVYTGSASGSDDAFDKDLSTRYIADADQYTGDNPGQTYTGNVQTDGYFGDYVQVDIGQEVILKNFTVTTQMRYEDFRIFYSSDGTNWTLLQSWTAAVTNNEWEGFSPYYYITNQNTNVTGRYFRLQVNKISMTRMYLREFELNGILPSEESTYSPSYWNELLHVTDAGPWTDLFNSNQSWDITNPGIYRYYRFALIKLYSSTGSGSAGRQGGIGKFILKGVRNIPSELEVALGAGDPNTQATASGVDISGLITNFTSTAVNISDAFPGNAVAGREAEINKWGWMGSANSDSLTLETTDIQDVNTIDLHIWKITITL